MGDDKSQNWDLPKDDLTATGLPKTNPSPAGNTGTNPSTPNTASANPATDAKPVFEYQKSDDPFVFSDSLKSNATVSTAPGAVSPGADTPKLDLASKLPDMTVTPLKTPPSTDVSTPSVINLMGTNLAELETKLKGQQSAIDDQIKALEEKKTKLAGVLEKITALKSEENEVISQAQDILK